MIRNLKAFGLALVAVLALGAVVASAASAQNGTLKTDGPVTLTMEETGVGKNWLRAFGAKDECPGSTYTGHKVLTVAETEAGKKHTPIPPGSSTVTITPHRKETNAAGEPNCKVPGLGLTTTTDINGCDYVLHFGATTPGVDTYTVTIDIVCPLGKQIETTLWTGAHTAATFCSIDVPAQNGLRGFHATDTTNGHIDITGITKEITAKKTKHGVLCPEENTNTAEMEIDVTVKGHNEAGGATTIGIDHA